MLRLSVLGSGSSGNAAVVCLGDDTRILVDAGLSARQLCLRLETVGIEPDSLTGIVLTHEHGDHSCGLDVFLRKREIPVFATRDTSLLVSEKLKSPVPWRIFEAGAAFEVGEAVVESFNVPHDAADPVGFVFRGSCSSVGVLSDVGHVTQVIIDRLHGVDTLFTEANYDEVMLQNDIKRPWATKQRISNRHGHLSNDQTADLISAVARQNLHRVVLGHLSSDCNSPEQALRVIRERLEREGFPHVDLECACRKKPTPLKEAAAPAAVSGPNVEHHEVKYPTAEGTNENRVREDQQPDRRRENGPALTVPEPAFEQTEWAF
ncbi:MAG: MBL fold metallo-hydrolase [Verrucomicrobiales bacterium]|nr:MBL fold metallo-hydrolase [Verrucomicrobiales bacterium]